jgi:hypothetical protein
MQFSSVSVANAVLCIKDVLMSFFLLLAVTILQVRGSMVLEMWVICSYKTSLFNFRVKIVAIVMHVWLIFSPLICRHVADLRHLQDTIPQIRNKYSQKRNFAATVPISTFMCPKQFIYSHDRSVFSAAGKYLDPILGIYK